MQATSADDFRTFIERGDADAVSAALNADGALANSTVHWYLNQPNESDPLHFVSDCVGNGLLTNEREGEIASLLLAHGALINGSPGREPPLIAAASLGADRVARVLIEAGADLEATALFGARALHWAAWTGASAVVAMLIAKRAEMEMRCTEFGATPLFWAVHGYGPHGPDEKQDQIGAARALIEAGAEIATANKHGESALEMARRYDNAAMYELLRAAG